MPPFVGRKRGSTSPLPSPQPPAKRAKTTRSAAKPVQKARQPPKKAARFVVCSNSDSSSLSEVDSDEFEDVQHSSKVGKSKAQGRQAPEDSESDVDWEDAPAAAPDFSNREFKDINITVEKDEEPSYVRTNAKKGPSRREKQARMWAHKMHVQFLLWHNAKRNEWINDEKVQQILLKQLPSQIVREVEKWKRASGLIKDADEEKKAEDKKKKPKKWKANGERNERDWGRPSSKLDEGRPDMSSGDPIITLLKIFSAYWRKRFSITAPGLRKRGYGTRQALRKDIESYRNDKYHPAKHGEQIDDLGHFRRLAEKSEGSRDVGAQLFTALLRALGIQARLVASLQPVGFGFTKAEELIPRKIVDPESDSEDETNVQKSASKSGAKKKKLASARKSGGKSAPIDLDSANEASTSDSDSDSVVDVTPSVPKARPPKYDKDLMFPVYWAEAISPITSKVFPVSPFSVENSVATSAETLSAFEPKGAKAEKTHQVMAYVVAYSTDFSAKDVTVRYLRKHIWPGKTKGFRVPNEKITIHNERDNVKSDQEYDWFRHVLSNYRRAKNERLPVDEVEDASDLVPAEPEKKEVDGDTLQGLKSSAEFVIERHLRREEALLKSAEPVRSFVNGKGDKQEEIPVYSRSDVRRVMTAESWHKEGRRPCEGEAPMKLAPVRAVTLARKREAEEHLMRTGEKQMQGLYSQEQTEFIIPPPIQDGKIPKNSYGNIDCFVPSMVPKGAVHLPLKGCVRLCKKLEIDFAEAVVGFEFGNKMAVPVIHGVVIAKENERIVRDAWRQWNEEQRKKEETKMEKLVLEMWRKMVIGLRIRSRVQEQYGDAKTVSVHQNGGRQDNPIELEEDEDVSGGGFVPDHQDDDFGGGFLVDDEAHQKHEDLTFEHHAASQEVGNLVQPMSEQMEVDASQEYPTPVSTSVKSQNVMRRNRKKLSSVASDDSISDVVTDEQSDHSPPPRREDIEHNPSSKKPRAGRRSAGSSAKKVMSQGRSDRVRSTPARGAKTRIQSMSLDGATETSDYDVDLEVNVTAQPDSFDAPTTKRRGRPRKTAKAQAEKTPERGKRLLRKESTIVTSPYFE